MTERIDYLIRDTHCEKAIENFKILTSVPDWLIQNSGLYDSVTIKPNGLPKVTSSHLDGEDFEHIQLFAHLYEMVNSLFG